MESPIQILKSIGSNFYIKREDLINGLFNGVKERKIQGLIQALEKEKPKIVFLKGSLFSNFFLAIIPKLRILNIPFKIFITSSHSAKIDGNHFFLKLLTHRDELTSIDTFPTLIPPDCFVIEEGGDHLYSYLGLLSLGTEILSQMKTLNLTFDEIWIDAGTCATATVLLYSLSYYQTKTTLKIVSMKESEEIFLKKKELIFQELNSHLKNDVNQTIPFEILRPITAPSFGSTNQLIFNTISEFAKKTGVILDPIYSCKLFLTLKERIQNKTVLMIHTGGTLSISGFKERLKF